MPNVKSEVGLRTKDLIGADQRSDNNKRHEIQNSPMPNFLGVLPRLHRNSMLVHINMQV